MLVSSPSRSQADTMWPNVTVLRTFQGLRGQLLESGDKGPNLSLGRTNPLCTDERVSVSPNSGTYQDLVLSVGTDSRMLLHPGCTGSYIMRRGVVGSGQWKNTEKKH